MALEKEVVEQGLESRGLETTLAGNLSFDTEEQMNATLDSLKPRTFETIEDVLEDEKLSTMVRTYGDKRQSDLQSQIDKAKLDKKKPDKDDKKPDPINEEPEWAKTIREQNEKLLARNETETFTKKVTELGKADGLSTKHISRVFKGLKENATEAEIKAEIKSYKEELSELGIKEFGTPGGGKSGNNSNMKKIAEEWRDKQMKIKK